MGGEVGGPYPIEAIVAEVVAVAETRRTSLRAVMEEYFKRNPHLEGAKPLTRAFAAGVLRSYRVLDELARRVVGVEPGRMRPFERNLLRALLYEAKYRPVSADRVLGVAKRYGIGLGPRELSLVRELEPEDLARGLGEVGRLALAYSLPEWVVEYLLKLLGRREAEELMKAFNRNPTVWLRANTMKVGVRELVERLGRRGLVVEVDEHLPFMLRVVRGGVSPSRVPEHAQGLFYVQDKASALAVYALGGGELVADLTAAPGGKASLANQLWGAEVVALDLRGKRVGVMSRLLRRLGAEGVHAVNADSTMPPLRAKFRKVILDPDCSSLGRLGHSPEIRLWIKPELVHTYAAEQRRLLRAASELLERGGELVYSTCTLTLEENEENVLWARDVLGLEPVEVQPRVGLPGMLGLREAQRLYPHLHDTVGFFLAKLVKV
jgi:16S rRNA (cytosine967-C5)-methyltransferase